MATKVTIPKKLEAEIRALLESGPVMEKHGKTIRQLIASIDDALDKKTRKLTNQGGGVDAKDVVRVIKEVLGGKAYIPANPGQAFYAFVAKRCAFLGVSLSDIEKAAVHVRNGSKHVKLPTSIEWFIRKLDAVLEEEATQEEEEPAGEQEWQLNLGR